MRIRKGPTSSGLWLGGDAKLRGQHACACGNEIRGPSGGAGCLVETFSSLFFCLLTLRRSQKRLTTEPGFATVGDFRGTFRLERKRNSKSYPGAGARSSSQSRSRRPLAGEYCSHAYTPFTIALWVVVCVFPRGAVPWRFCPTHLFALFLYKSLFFSLYFVFCIEGKSSSLRASQAHAILPAPRSYFASCLPLALQYILGYLPLK